MASKKLNVGMLVVAITPKLHHIQIKKTAHTFSYINQSIYYQLCTVRQVNVN